MSSPDRKKAIHCFLASVIGWLIFAAGILFVVLRPYSGGDFYMIANFGFVLMSALIAGPFQLASLIYSVILLTQENQHRFFCGAALLSSIAFFIYILLLISGNAGSYLV